jgi:hypothetical protein
MNNYNAGDYGNDNTYGGGDDYGNW